MLTCDVCKKAIEGRRDILRQFTLPYEFVNGAWQTKNYDLCSNCQRILSTVVAQARCDFANGKYTEGEG